MISPPFLVAGPCVLEDDSVTMQIADSLVELGIRLGIPVVFKSSFDKANRSHPDAPRGPGLDVGLRALERVRATTGLPVLTDIHEPAQAARVAAAVDVLQIPAFLCRQTDLVVAAGAQGKPVNIKKGPWMAPEAMRFAVAKAAGAGAPSVWVTERGTAFGYGDLVVDMRSFARLHDATDAVVVYDGTHSVQQPGAGPGGSTGGARRFVAPLLLAAAAAGADAFFLETHPDPAHAASDGATMVPLAGLDALVSQALEVWHRAREAARA